MIRACPTAAVTRGWDRFRASASPARRASPVANRRPSPTPSGSTASGATVNVTRPAIGETGGGWIAVQAKRAGDFVEIAVRDSDPGFPPDLAANPFLPFASTKADGLGIGLALSRSIIEAHGGYLWLDTDGPGGVVCFTVPIVKGAGRG